MVRLADVDLHAEEMAALAGLTYVEDRSDGFERLRWGKGFTFRDASGRTLDGDERQRCLDLVIPPAWTEVWICPDPKGHLQAVGRDDAGRLQYLYHEGFRAQAERAKYQRLLPFGHALERIRRTVAVDLLADDPARRALAAGVRLIDRGLIRVGSDEPEDPDDAVGVTTMPVDAVTIDDGVVELDYVGKSGAVQHRRIEDQLLAGVLADIRRQGGSRLLSFRDGDVHRPVTATLVNRYLQGTTGQRFTAKDFRTWGGTVTLAHHLASSAEPDLVAAVDAAAERLGNTRAVARASYCAPAISEAHESGLLLEVWERTRSGKWLDRPERTVVRVLEEAAEAAEQRLAAA